MLISLHNDDCDDVDDILQFVEKNSIFVFFFFGG